MTRDFRLLAAGMTLSWLGGGFQTVALAVAILLAGGGAGDLGLVLASSVIAMLACTLFGGVWADRRQPARVMVLSDAVRFAATASMALMFATGTYHLPLLCGLAAISSGAGSFFNPAMMSLKPMLVSPGRRQSANATLSLLQTVCMVIGPAVGGGSAAGLLASAEGLGGVVGAAVAIRLRPRRLLRAAWLTLLLMPLWSFAYVWPGVLTAVVAGRWSATRACRSSASPGRRRSRTTFRTGRWARWRPGIS